MSEKPITITIKGEVGYEDEITVAQAARIITFLNADEGDASLGPDLGAGLDDRPAAPHPRRQGSRSAVPARRWTCRGPRRTQRRSLPSGSTSCRTAARPSRSRTSRRSSGAPETAPGNFSRDLAAAVQEGWIGQGDSDEYDVTNKIQGIFDGDFKFPKSKAAGGES